MALAGLELLVAHVGIGRDREDQVVDLGLAGPVVRMGLVADHRVLLVGDQLERACADRLQVGLLWHARGVHLLGILGRMDRREVHAQVGDEGGLRYGQSELHRMIVDLLDRLDDVRHVHRLEVLVASARHLVEGMGLVLLAVEAEQHVIGIEIPRRREVLGRVELHVLAQLEGVGEPVVGHVPGFGQGRHDLGGAALELDQAIEDLARRGIEGGARGVERGAEALGAAFGAIDECLGLRCCPEREATGNCERSQQNVACHINLPVR